MGLKITFKCANEEKKLPQMKLKKIEILKKYGNNRWLEKNYNNFRISNELMKNKVVGTLITNFYL